MVFTTQCPKCGKILWFSSKLAGTVTICPACGGTMLLEAPPPPPVATPAPEGGPEAPPKQGEGEAESADNKVPEAVEQSLLTHQAAAAVGEVHVDFEESDLVQWTQPQNPPPPPALPPVWAPPPLSGIPPPPSGEPGPQWFPLASRQSSALAPRWRGGLDETERKTRLVAAVAVVAAAVLVAVLVWYVSRIGRETAWEQAHRSELLSIKQNAENLTVSGQYGAAYQKYQELERLTAGRPIEDPYLRSELEKSWMYRDWLRDRLMAGVREPPQTQPAATAPSGTPEQEAPQAGAATQPAAAGSTTTAPTAAARPAVRATPLPSAGITDAQIGASIKKGVDFLLQQFDGTRLPPGATTAEYYDGLQSLAVYALMQSGLATHDQRLDIHGKFMSGAIDAVKRLRMDDRAQTYGRAIRATALALYNRRQDQAIIRQDVQWLLGAQDGGAFTYTDQFPRHSGVFFWDNSNSQYGLLGVWSGAEAGAAVPIRFWRDVQEHWTGCQLPDGQWTYKNGDQNARRSMTLAGIASLFVTQDYLDAQDWGERVGRPPFSPALAKGLAWLEDGDNSVITQEGEEDWTYTLYGLERTGLASGFKYFGSHDWYRERAADAMAWQNGDGSWNTSYGNLVGTSYALLFLARGRHPVIMNKLRFDGDWANRPRDVANLARFASAQLERPLNWQVVPLNHDWHDWTDSPILYLASDRPPPWAPEDDQKLRKYIENGGMLLTQADGESAAFSQFVTDLGQRLFPQYPWTDLPPDHPLRSVVYKITEAPTIRVITNGSRILMMHWPTDITRHWQLRQDNSAPGAFELGVNLVLYAAGKSALRNRLESEQIAAAATPAAAATRLARLRYDGNWDPEPAAWPRAARWFRQQTGLDIALEATDVQDVAASNPPLAHLTGTAALKATDAQVDAVKKYVDGGGVLLVDPCGIAGDFFRSVQDDLLARAFPDAHLEPIDAAHPLLTASADGMEDVSAVLVREFVRTLADAPRQPMMFRAGKGHVIVLPLDLTSGLLGTSAWGIAGYSPSYALPLMQNIVLWTWDGQREPS